MPALMGTPLTDSTVRALVILIEDDQGGYHLAVQFINDFRESTAPRLNASWIKRTRPARTPKP
jgi:hypothetical protein